MPIDLTGAWKAVYSEIDGEMTPVSYTTGIIISFLEDKFKIEVHGVEEHAGTYQIDETVSPPHVTYIYTKSSSYQLNAPRVGIVQQHGSTFKDSLGPIGAAPPASFNTFPGSNSVMTVHQRSGEESGRGKWTTFSVSPNAVVSQW